MELHKGKVKAAKIFLLLSSMNGIIAIVLLIKDIYPMVVFVTFLLGVLCWICAFAMIITAIK